MVSDIARVARVWSALSITSPMDCVPASRFPPLWDCIGGEGRRNTAMAADIQFLCEHVMLGILRGERIGNKLILPFRKTAAETLAGTSFCLGSTEQRVQSRD